MWVKKYVVQTVLPSFTVLSHVCCVVMYKILHLCACVCF